MRTPQTLSLLMCLMLLGQAAPSDEPADPTSALGVRQQHAARLIADMQERFARLAERLEIAEPEHAARLAEALERSRQALLAQHMRRIAGDLDAGELQQARERQDQVIGQLETLVAILTDAHRDDDLPEEVERLERISEQINRLIEQQADLKQRTGEATDPRKALENIDAQIAAVERIKAAQQALGEKTDQARRRGPHALAPLSDEQGELGKQTDALAEATENPSLERAAGAQARAASKLGEGRGPEAGDAQQQATEALAEALDELKRQRDRIARLGPEEMNALSGDQDDLAKDAGGVAAQMPPPPEGGQGQQGQPGQPQVQRAQQHMQQAAQRMQQQQGDQAQQQQQQALDELQQARDEIEQRLRQLREQMKEDILANLESRFAEMLVRQQPITRQTAELDGQRQGDAELTRPEQLQLAGLASEERDLGDAAERALTLIREDGTTVVFPQIVEQLAEDFDTAADLLARRDSGTYTQEVQAQIERTLEQLIDALKRAQDVARNQAAAQQGQPQQPPPDQLPPLVPDSAELKLLKAAQLRVNDRTQAFDAARPNDAALQPTMRNEVHRLADRQDQLRRMAEDMSLHTPIGSQP